MLRLRRVGNAAALADAFAAEPSLGERDIATQQQAIDEARGPFSAPIPAELRRLGWEADDLILGVPSIREAWVREYGPLPRISGIADPDVLLAVGEVLRRRPDVVLDQNLNVLDRAVIRHLREHAPEIRLLVGQMGTAKRFHRALHLDLSLVPCSTIAGAIRPHLRGPVRVLHHSFNPEVLDGLSARDVQHPLVFAGALGPRYVLRNEVLIALLESTPLKAWVSLRKGVSVGEDGLLATDDQPRRSIRASVATTIRKLPIPLLAASARRSDRFAGEFNNAIARRAGGRVLDVRTLEDPRVRFGERCHTPVAGRAYLELLRSAGVVVHCEGDEVNGCGAALRQFEVTGIGATLLANSSPMLRNLFEDGKEVVLFDSPQDAVEKAQWLLDHPEERERIAAAGHSRTMRDHTTAVRAGELAELLSEQLGASPPRLRRR